MLFNSYEYWLFFTGVMAAVYLGPSGLRRPILLLSSFAFYAAWSIELAALLVASSAFNWATGRIIEASTGRARRIALTICLTANLSLLGFFKYYNFAIGSLAELMGFPETTFYLHIILPIAISFYTFEAISYNVDVFRRQVAARRSWIDVALLLSFFPHLVAGPILRPKDFFPQLSRAPVFDTGAFRAGLLQIVKGLIKKTVLADNLAVIVNEYYAHGVGHSSPWITLVALVAFSFQIYFDFSGYTDIARGCARMLGFRFPPNFQRPYLSPNIAAFWRRWHISLSIWLRDYLYVPLGGNRYGETRASMNLMLTMALGGLWHGASWNYLVWGIYQGALLVIHRQWRRIAPALPAGLNLKFLGVALTFTMVTLGWIPFRAVSFAQSKLVFMDLLGLSQDASWHFPALATQPGENTLLAMILLMIFWLIVDRRRRLQAWLLRGGVVREGTAITLALIALVILSRTDTAVQFIYFQF